MISIEPLVTVGIPFFDEEEHLAAAIRSVLAQSWKRIEVLLVDDGSSDRSLAIARSFDDSRIRVLSNGERRYLPARLNEIVRQARGELVARMDADDVIHPDRLRKQVERLRETDAVASGTWAGIVDAREALLGIVESAPQFTPAAALERGLLTHASLVARRDWLAAYPYDERLTRAEDRDLWCRTLGTRFAVVDEPLYVVRTSVRDPSFLSDYLESQRQNRILYRRYGARLVGPVRAARRYGESVLKSWIMTGAVTLGAAQRLVRRRGRSATQQERLLVEEALRASRAPLA